MSRPLFWGLVDVESSDLSRQSTGAGVDLEVFHSTSQGTQLRVLPQTLGKASGGMLAKREKAELRGAGEVGWILESMSGSGVDCHPFSGIRTC